MTTGTAAGESICKTFVTAVLLSGSAEWAEAAMLDGIESGEGDEELLERTIASLLRPGARLGIGESTRSLASLPQGLRDVLRLRSDLRRCFVLRVLMAWPRERCAALLRLDVADVDRAVSTAAVELAEIAAREGQTGTTSHSRL